MEETVTIQLNGRPHRIPHGTTVSALLAELGFTGPSALVEHNGTALFPREFPDIFLQEQDVLEVIRVVAGG